MKIGAIDVLNVLPVFYGIFSNRIKLSGELIFGKVTELNQALQKGEIDLSVISSFEYAKNPERYYVLPNLSISCNGPVKSIYLFTKKPLTEFQKGDSINLTISSYTSIHLIQYLLKDFQINFSINQTNFDGIVKIADDAIQTYYRQDYEYSYDLGELWYEKTGLPFVFAVWAVRSEFYEKNKSLVRECYEQILESKKKYGTLFNEMSKEYNHGIFPNDSDCKKYLENLNYDFGEKYLKGFYLFQEEMKKLGHLRQIAPVRFINV